MNRCRKIGVVGGVASVVVAFALSAALVAPGSAWAGSHLKAQSGKKELQIEKKAQGSTGQGTGKSISPECAKPGQSPGAPRTGQNCPDKGVNVGSQKNIGGSGGTPDVSKSIPGYGGGSKVTTSSPGGQLVDPREKATGSKDKPAGKFDDLSPTGKLKNLSDGMSKVKEGHGSGGAPAGLIKGADSPLKERDEAISKFNEGRKGPSKQEQQSDTHNASGEKSLSDKIGDAAARAYGAISGAVRDAVGPEKYDKAREPAPCFGCTAGTRGTPNPDAVDTTHDPAYLQGKAKVKTPAEKEAERKRQVTLPPDDQKGGRPDKADLGKVYMSPEEKKQRAMDHMTGGKIRPVEGDGSRGDGAGTATGARGSLGVRKPGTPNNPTGRVNPGPNPGPSGPGDPESGSTIGTGTGTSTGSTR